MLENVILCWKYHKLSVIVYHHMLIFWYFPPEIHTNKCHKIHFIQFISTYFSKMLQFEKISQIEKISWYFDIFFLIDIDIYQVIYIGWYISYHQIAATALPTSQWNVNHSQIRSISANHRHAVMNLDVFFTAIWREHWP